jgi:hypothetical protein
MYKDQDQDLSSHLYTNTAHTVIRQLEGILLTRGGHLHNRIISLNRRFWLINPL